MVPEEQEEEKKLKQQFVSPRSIIRCFGSPLGHAIAAKEEAERTRDLVAQSALNLYLLTH